MMPGVISMKKDKVILFAIISALLFYICPTIAYADSSWVWVSEIKTLRCFTVDRHTNYCHRNVFHQLYSQSA